MPREDQHVQKARLNEEFAKELDKTVATAEVWSVIIIFYAALHYVQSYFVKCGAGEDCHNHQTREIEIGKDHKLKYILPHYQYLYTMSHSARYKCIHFATVYPNAYTKAEQALMTIKTQVDKAKKS